MGAILLIGELSSRSLDEVSKFGVAFLRSHVKGVPMIKLILLCNFNTVPL